MATQEPKKKRRFEIVAYTGEPLEQGWWNAPVIVDLEGIDTGDGILPILDGHFAARGGVVGQSESAAVQGGQLVLRGVMFEREEAARKIIRLADQGFKWQASIGANCAEKEFVGENATVTVNNRTHQGPCYVSRRTILRETSFVVLGADRKTSVVVAGQGIVAGDVPAANSLRLMRPVSFLRNGGAPRAAAPAARTVAAPTKKAKTSETTLWRFLLMAKRRAWVADVPVVDRERAVMALEAARIGFAYRTLPPLQPGNAPVVRIVAVGEFPGASEVSGDEAAHHAEYLLKKSVTIKMPRLPTFWAA